MLPTLYQERIKSPLGPLRIVHDGERCIRALDFDDYEGRMVRLLRLHYGRAGVEFELKDAATDPAIADPIAAYFDGDLTALDQLSTRTNGTPFQRNVWNALRKIPAGTTMSYGALAEAIGQPKAVRAVGLANGANPIAIIVPCHRVIGANMSLTGYGGGLERKRWLLAHEGVLLDTGPVARPMLPGVAAETSPAVPVS